MEEILNVPRRSILTSPPIRQLHILENLSRPSRYPMARRQWPLSTQLGLCLPLQDRIVAELVLFISKTFKCYIGLLLILIQPVSKSRRPSSIVRVPVGLLQLATSLDM